jgi:hypothetical protein
VIIRVYPQLDTNIGFIMGQNISKKKNEQEEIAQQTSQENELIRSDATVYVRSAADTTVRGKKTEATSVYLSSDDGTVNSTKKSRLIPIYFSSDDGSIKSKISAGLPFHEGTDYRAVENKKSGPVSVYLSSDNSTVKSKTSGVLPFNISSDDALVKSKASGTLSFHVGSDNSTVKNKKSGVSPINVSSDEGSMQIQCSKLASISKSSEQYYDFYCDPCKTVGDHVEAEGFCTNCEENLCITCFRSH